MTVLLRRRFALAIALLFALVTVAPVLAAESVTYDSSETQFEPGHSIDWQLAALSIVPTYDSVDAYSGLALGAVRFRVDIPEAAPCALLFARPQQQVRSPARQRPSRARAPPRRTLVG